MEKGEANDLGLDFCIRVFDNGVDYNWFLINSNTTQTSIVYPLFSMPRAPNFYSSVASHGSMVYISGGLDLHSKTLPWPDSKDVYCIDTRCPEKGFKQLPSMNCGRGDHGSIFVGEKLYVWGSGTETTTYAEVYDTKRKKWDFLDHLPHDVRLRGVESTWETYINDKIFYEEYNSAYVGGIVYSLCRISGDMLSAFDPSAPSEPKTVVSANSEVDLFDFLPNYEISEDSKAPSRYVLSLGEDILGVVYLDHTSPLEPDLMKNKELSCLREIFKEFSDLHCCKFRMKHKKGEEKITAELIYHSRHLILGGDIDKCVAVVGRRSEEEVEQAEKEDEDDNNDFTIVR